MFINMKSAALSMLMLPGVNRLHQSPCDFGQAGLDGTSTAFGVNTQPTQSSLARCSTGYTTLVQPTKQTRLSGPTLSRYILEEIQAVRRLRPKYDLRMTHQQKVLYDRKAAAIAEAVYDQFFAYGEPINIREVISGISQYKKQLHFPNIPENHCHLKDPIHIRDNIYHTSQHFKSFNYALISALRKGVRTESGAVELKEAFITGANPVYVVLKREAHDILQTVIRQRYQLSLEHQKTTYPMLYTTQFSPSSTGLSYDWIATLPHYSIERTSLMPCAQDKAVRTIYNRGALIEWDHGALPDDVLRPSSDFLVDQINALIDDIVFGHFDGDEAFRTLFIKTKYLMSLPFSVEGEFGTQFNNIVILQALRYFSERYHGVQYDASLAHATAYPDGTLEFPEYRAVHGWSQFLKSHD